jgi:hypothetical protein
MKEHIKAPFPIGLNVVVNLATCDGIADRSEQVPVHNQGAGCSNAPALEYGHRGRFDPLAQSFVQAVSCHDVGFTAKDFGGALLDVHQLEQLKRALLVIEKQIDIGIPPRLAAGGRAEQIEMLDAGTPSCFSSASCSISCPSGAPQSCIIAHSTLT